LNWHPIPVARFAATIYPQRAYPSDPHIIQTHFQKLGKIMQAKW
jgi:hypothetical protein